MPRYYLVDLIRVARQLGFVLERAGREYELWSNEHEPGVVRICGTLAEVAEELAGIRYDQTHTERNKPMESNTFDITTADRVTLYYREGRSDKVYSVEIEPDGDGHRVKFAYGRRGSALRTGTKTQAPVALAKARSIFEKLVRSKMAKGYTPGEDGTPYQDTPDADAHTGITCQLLNPIDADDLDTCLDDPQYVAQEKMDGERRLVRLQSGAMTGINRRGLQVALSKPIVDALAALPVDCILDGEQVGDVLHVFDILAHDGVDLHAEPYSDRLAVLQTLLESVDTDGPLRLVPTAHTADDKRDLHARLLSEGREGIVFKDRRAPYTPGRPASGGSQLKHKFYETATCVVTAHNAQRSVAIALMEAGATIPCGNVTVPPNQSIPAVGATVEVRYLYAFPQSHVLYQPVLLGVRSDIDTADCELEQLKYKAA